MRYHGNNETFLIQSGHITWRYWLRKVKELNVTHGRGRLSKRVSTDSGAGEHVDSTDFVGVEGGGAAPATNLPCRVSVSVTGVEWFVYNRSAAYDAVMAGITQHQREEVEAASLGSAKAQAGDDGSKLRKRMKRQEPGDKEDDLCSRSKSNNIADSSPLTEKSASTFPSLGHYTYDSETSHTRSKEADEGLDSNFLLETLPFEIDCSTAAVVVGNENTKSVLIAKVERAIGEVDATVTSGPDHYKQLLNFRFIHPVIQIKPNDDYKEDQTTAARRANHGMMPLQPEQTPLSHRHSWWQRYRHRAWHVLQDLIPQFRSSVDTFASSIYGSPPTVNDSIGDETQGANQWHGLSRYLDDSEQDDQARWSAVEYATVSTVFDSPEASMNFYWDVPGQVTDVTAKRHRGQKDQNNINGDLPPDYGLDFFVKGATIHYGPWADRQRADLQRVFFPSLCKDSVPAVKLKPGDRRVATLFKIYIQLDEDTTLRVPIREQSKNWKWKCQADALAQERAEDKHQLNRGIRKARKAEKGKPGPDVRPFGWLDVKVASNATVSYTMEMVGNTFGFANHLDLDIRSMEITTSVNHGLLLRSANQRISCDLSNPLQWNSLRSWTFDVNMNGLELFILREHIFLLTDLIDDFGSGPPPEYLTFIPFKYSVKLQMGDFRLYLNANDSNIINNPSDFDDNTFVIIFGSALSADLVIPLDKFRPHTNDITFDVTAETGGLDMHVPPWNTQATFLSSTELALLKGLSLNGKYQYCGTTGANNTDTLLLDLHGSQLSVQLYGFLIRYLMKIKDNYFGDDIHFKTLDEYQELLSQKQSDPDTSTSESPPSKKSNDLDVILSITAEDIGGLLPSNLYCCKNHVRIDISSLAADLRFTNYYMDLQVAFSTLALSLGNEDGGATTPMSATSSTQLFINGVDVHGHRLFGLPPTEPTYVCNWDFAVGAITGECTANFLAQIAAGGQAFAFAFDDEENALPSISNITLHDITFLRATVEPIRVWLHVEEAAFLLSIGAITLNYDDWAGSHYSEKMKLSVPALTVACVDAESAVRHRSRKQQPVETHAYFQTTITLSMIERKSGFMDDRDQQQKHVKLHDQRTSRVAFLSRPQFLDLGQLGNLDAVAVESPAMCFPPMPEPLPQVDIRTTSSKISVSSSSVHIPTVKLQRKSSFLSTVSSSASSRESVLRSRVNRSHSQALNTATHNSRSRSHRTAGTAERRNTSTSTGRQSSFHSATGDWGDRKGLPPSSVAFSNAYVAPYFPLDTVEPDTDLVPSVDEIMHEMRKDGTDELDFVEIDDRKFDDSAVHTSFIVALPEGIRAFVNPSSVHAIAQLLSSMQAKEPADILDNLQIASIREISEVRKRKMSKGKTIDISVRIPAFHLRSLNTLPSRTGGPPRNEHDQYDICVSGLVLTARMSTLGNHGDETESAKEHSAVHLRVKSAGITAKERFGDLDDAQAAVHARVEELAFWSASSDMLTANANVKVVEVLMSSDKIEYLASLIHRTSLLAADLSDTFSKLSERQLNRLRSFIYYLTMSGQEAADPLFMARPSYVLRSATDHLRTTDSWKTAARLRHIYSARDESAKFELAMRCLDNAPPCPDDAREQVLAGFQQWRSWDLINLHKCFLMKKVYGPPPDADVVFAVQESRPFGATFKLGRLALVLDPGPKQNEIALESITTSINISPPVVAPADMEFDPQPKSIFVQVYCVSAGIDLNWGLCELAENVLHLYKDSLLDPGSPIGSTAASTKAQEPREAALIHMVVATEKGWISIETINVRAMSISKGLKCSLLLRPSERDVSKAQANFIIGAEAATTKLRSHSQELTLSQIRHPSIFVSYEPGVFHDVPTNTWKITGNCQELSYVFRQDTIAMVEVVDLVIGDEVAQIYRLRNTLPTSPMPVPDTNPSSKDTAINSIHVGLFLDMYHISVPLLQSLTYNISGVIARASVAYKSDSEVVFDFDIKEHSHDMQTQLQDEPLSISLLQMPPTNGRVTSQMRAKETLVSLFVSVEPVELDAAALYSLLTALNRPEISSVIKELKVDIDGAKAHIEEIFGSGEIRSVRPPEIAPKQLIYDAHLIVAGLDVYANTPGIQGAFDKVRLDLNFGCIQLEIANRVEQHGPTLEFPELRLGLQRIMFELCRISEHGLEPCGNLAFATLAKASSKTSSSGDLVRLYHLMSSGLKINIFANTASTVVDVLAHLQHKIKDLDLSRERKYLRRLRKPRPHITISDDNNNVKGPAAPSVALFASMYALELLDIQLSWIVGSSTPDHDGREKEDLVLSLRKIDLSTKKENSAKLTIEDLQLQMVPVSQSKNQRSLNSALLPEVVFNVAYVSTREDWRLAFQVAGKSLDLRLTSQFILPAADLKMSISSASDKVRAATATWASASSRDTGEKRAPMFGNKRMASLLVDADFAGAVVYLQGKRVPDRSTPESPNAARARGIPQHGRYGQFSQEESGRSTTLRAPGLAFKVEYKDNGSADPSLQGEVRVDASTNIIYPTVVPLIMEISSSVKEIVGDEHDGDTPAPVKPSSPQKFMGADDENILTTDPSAVLGRTRLNLGLRICQQEFSLSCQPIARVAATARFDDIYLTINTVRSLEHGHFFAISAAFTRLSASVQHVYSRESTGSFEVETLVLSVMNSKHVSGKSGVSTILKVSPMKLLINAKQVQDFLLFREIWVPSELRQSSQSIPPPSSSSSTETPGLLVQRYQQVAATSAFPWNATVSIAELDVQLDLGQAIGKSRFMISNFWVSSRKKSDWEQNMCLGFDKIGVDSSGRMSGFVTLQNFKLRTSIQWPARELAVSSTPLIQSSIGFSQLRVKSAFDYQAFLVADITSFDFLMYNVRNESTEGGDRLVAILNGDAVQIFCTTTTASQGLALYQAFLRLAQEKKANYETSLKEIERYMRRKSIAHPLASPHAIPAIATNNNERARLSISLHTDVVVTLRAVNIGAFPSTFFDNQVFKLEALNAQARFAVSMDSGKLHSALGLTLGQLRIGLAGVKRPNVPKTLGEVSVDDVVSSAIGSRGGTILKVPKLQATMDTWHAPNSTRIDYIFKSAFEGKVEVGWNYSRISYIRGMWASHSKALAQRLGKPLPPSAVKISGVPQPDDEGSNSKQQKITAEVNVPQSKYQYVALQPPIIETPQLRDMGEATPPLEWIGLNRDRLPNLTHQIVIVALLEVASEVEEAYAKILGSSR